MFGSSPDAANARKTSGLTPSASTKITKSTSLLPVGTSGRAPAGMNLPSVLLTFVSSLFNVLFAVAAVRAVRGLMFARTESLTISLEKDTPLTLTLTT